MCTEKEFPIITVTGILQSNLVPIFKLLKSASNALITLHFTSCICMYSEIGKMGSISKYSTLSQDRISNLPNEIIAYILSFLPTKLAVATSILSKRWVNVWNYVTTLDLGCKYLPLKISIIYRVLLLCKASSLHKFRLQVRGDYQASDVNSWIDYALRCNVEHLDIFVDCLDEYSLLSSKLFSSTTLTVLKLDAYNIIMNIPSSFCLPSVKIVHLGSVRFLNDDQFTRFICGCPVLEELNLQRLRGSDLHVIKIVAPLLKRLVLFRVLADDISYKIIINAPSLVYLELRSCFADLFTIVDSPNLIEANIFFDAHDWKHSEGIIDFLKGISSVQCLELCWFDLELMMKDLVAEGHHKFPKFQNLKVLTLQANYECDFLAELLQNSPNLETLEYIELRKVLDPEQQWKFECQTISPGLKFIDISMRTGLKSCADMINYFLHKTKALEKLFLQIAYSEGVEQELQKMLNYIPKNYDVVKVKMEYSCPSVFVWKLLYASRSRRSQLNKITRK